MLHSYNVIAHLVLYKILLKTKETCTWDALLFYNWFVGCSLKLVIYGNRLKIKIFKYEQDSPPTARCPEGNKI